MSKLLLISGGTGSGKTSLVKMLTKYNYGEVVSHTNRHPRTGDVDGVDFYFTTEEEMNKIEFIEKIKFGNNVYGISKKEFTEKLDKHENIVIVVGIDGLQQILNWLANNKLDIDLDVIHIHLNIPRELRQKRILEEELKHVGYLSLENMIGENKESFLEDILIDNKRFNIAYHKTLERLNRNNDDIDSRMLKMYGAVNLFKNVRLKVNRFRQLYITMPDSLQNAQDSNIDLYYGNTIFQLMDILEKQDICKNNIPLTDSDIRNPYLDVYSIEYVKHNDMKKVTYYIERKDLDFITAFVPEANKEFVEKNTIKNILDDLPKFDNVEYEFVIGNDNLKQYLKGRDKNNYLIVLTNDIRHNMDTNRNNGSHALYLPNYLLHGHKVQEQDILTYISNSSIKVLVNKTNGISKDNFSNNFISVIVVRESKLLKC